MASQGRRPGEVVTQNTGNLQGMEQRKLCWSLHQAKEAQVMLRLALLAVVQALVRLEHLNEAYRP
jgi:hypothetical protein